MELFIRDEFTNDYIGNFYDVWYDQSANVLTVKEMNQVKSDESRMIITEISESVDLDLNEIFKSNNVTAIYGLKNLNAPFSKNIVIDGKNKSKTLVEKCFNDALRQFYGFPQMSILCAKNINEMIVVINGTVRTEVSCIVNKNDLAIDIMKKVYPSFATEADIWEAKDELVRKVDPNNSLSYLEAQLDLLTNIIFGIYDSLPSENREKICADYPYLENLRQEFFASSVTNIKDVEKCLDEIRVGKNKIRYVQKEYYKVKGY